MNMMLMGFETIEIFITKSFRYNKILTNIFSLIVDKKGMGPRVAL